MIKRLSYPAKISSDIYPDCIIAVDLPTQANVGRTSS